MNQPIPQISQLDLERVVNRDFDTHQHEHVWLLLAEYGLETSHKEPLRVRMASLKLAKGNLDALKAEINTAKSDYRDVLAYAEYPGYMSNTFASKLDEAERQRIVDEDWKQYQDWFKK